MAMSNKGLSKLVEELGELQQVAGKILAYGLGEHPDGKGELSQRFIDEAADVSAAIIFYMMHNGLSGKAMDIRRKQKLQLFMEWESEP